MSNGLMRMGLELKLLDSILDDFQQYQEGLSPKEAILKSEFEPFSNSVGQIELETVFTR